MKCKRLINPSFKIPPFPLKEMGRKQHVHPPRMPNSIIYANIAFRVTHIHVHAPTTTFSYPHL